MDSLLRYLIYIVLHDESQETANDRVKQNLLDLLKTDDYLREQLLGSIGAVKNKSHTLSEHECQELVRMGLISAQTQQKVQQAHSVNMDLEMNDQLSEHLFSVKFVAFKTPTA